MQGGERWRCRKTLECFQVCVNIQELQDIFRELFVAILGLNRGRECGHKPTIPVSAAPKRPGVLF